MNKILTKYALPTIFAVTTALSPLAAQSNFNHEESRDPVNMKLNSSRTSVSNDLGKIVFENTKDGEIILSKGKIGINLPSGKYLDNVGVFNILAEGSDGKLTMNPGIWSEKQFEKYKLLGDAELMVKEGFKPCYMIMGGFYGNKISGEAFILKNAEVLDRNNVDVLAWAGVHDNNKYLSAGYGFDKIWSVAGITGHEDFGNVTFGFYDVKTNDWKVKSQTGIKNASKGFFSTENLDFSSGELVIPKTFKQHFSPLTTKGNYTVRLEANGNKENYSANIAVGTNLLPIEIAVGMIYNSQEGNGALVELNKNLDVGSAVLKLEGKYDTVSGNAGIYAILDMKMGEKNE
ncbi:MAG: hypothetical protein ABIB43_03825 [archaeon]